MFDNLKLNASLAPIAILTSASFIPSAFADTAAVDGLAAAIALSSAATDADIVVTAQRRQENIQDVPLAITAVSGDRLDRNGLRDASEIALFVPNFNAQPSGRTSPRWFLRGVGVADGTTSPIGIYLDDVYLSNTLITNFPLFDVERVEVLRGPQGTLWGKNTTAGAINYISKKPSFTPGGFLNLQYGNFDTKTVIAAYGGPVSDKVAFRVALNGDFTNGYSKNEYDGTPVGKTNQVGIRTQLLYRPDDSTDILANYHYNNFDSPYANQVNGGISTLPDGSNGFGYVFPDRGPDYFNSIGPAFYRIEHQGGFLNISRALGDLTLVSITALDHLDSSSQTGTFVPQQQSRSRSQVKDTQVSQELRLSSSKDNRLSWIIGAHFFDEKLEGSGATAILPGTRTPTVQQISYRTRIKSYAGFLSTTYKITDAFQLTGGIRVTHEKKTNNLRTVAGVAPVTFSDPGQFWLPNAVSTPLAVVAQQDASRSWTAVTYDVTPELELSSNARVYVRYAKGFKSGGFNNTAANQAAVTIVNPETIKDIEGGIKTEWFNRRLIANLAAFNYDYNDIQINQVTPTGVGGTFVSTIRNAGKGYSRGIELELRTRPTDRLEIDGSLGLLWTKYTRFQVSPTVSAAGNEFIRAPRVSATVGARYEIPVSDTGRLSIATDWQYRSKFYFNATTQTPLLTQRDLLIGNARLSYAFDDRWELSVFSQNITNRRFPTTVLPTTFGATTFEAPPRTYGARLSVKL